MKIEKRKELNLLSSTEFCRLIGISYNTFLRIREAGMLPKGIKIGCYTYYKKTVASNYIKNGF